MYIFFRIFLQVGVVCSADLILTSLDNNNHDEICKIDRIYSIFLPADVLPVHNLPKRAVIPTSLLLIT
jgi:hypothetical protein